MADFTLDTSGVVRVIADPGYQALQEIGWSDLSPFTQGYVEAALQEFAQTSLRGIGWSRNCPRCVGSKFCCDEHNRPVAFSDLVPETLARIMEDCERWQARFPTAKTSEQGAALWSSRQNPTGYFTGWNLDFPPLTVSLGDDGKVRLL